MLEALLKPFGIGSIIIRAIIWIGAVMVLAYGASEGHKRTQVKAEAGWFFVFLITTGIMIYVIFGYAPVL